MPLAAAILAIKPSYDPLVLAAASVQESRKAAAVGRLRKEHAPPVMSFAASSALVRQVDAAAPTNIFISAEEEWMNYLAQRGKVRACTKVSCRFNRPVLMAPRIEQGAADDRPESPLARAVGDGLLATAAPDSGADRKVYKEALTKLGVRPKRLFSIAGTN